LAFSSFRSFFHYAPGGASKGTPREASRVDERERPDADCAAGSPWRRGGSQKGWKDLRGETTLVTKKGIGQSPGGKD